MKTYLTDLDGVVTIDPSFRIIERTLETLEGADEYDFPEIILSRESGYSLLISPGYRIVLEKEETEVGLVWKRSYAELIQLVDAFLKDKDGSLGHLNWEGMPE